MKAVLTGLVVMALAGSLIAEDAETAPAAQVLHKGVASNVVVSTSDPVARETSKLEKDRTVQAIETPTITVTAESAGPIFGKVSLCRACSICRITDIREIRLREEMISDDDDRGQPVTGVSITRSDGGLAFHWQRFAMPESD